MDKRTQAKFTALTARISTLENSINTGVSVRGVPAGGEQGQVLAKKSDTDYSTEWIDTPVPEAITNVKLEEICKL